MNTTSSGWVKLHRKIVDSPGYFSEPFCKNMAWIDLLLLANYEDNFFYVRGNKVDVKRGQCGYAEETLAKRWKWSRGKVRRFLEMLVKEEKIVQQKNNVTTLLSIVNYDTYQSVGTTDDTADGQQTDINKKGKKDKKERRKEFVPPTLDEVKEYFKENSYQTEVAEKAYKNYAEAPKPWHDKMGNKVLDWKAKMRNVWFKDEHKIATPVIPLHGVTKKISDFI